MPFRSDAERVISEPKSPRVAILKIIDPCEKDPGLKAFAPRETSMTLHALIAKV